MNKPAKEIAEAIISGTRLIDRETIHLAYELADAVISEAASSEPVGKVYRNHIFGDTDLKAIFWLDPSLKEGDLLFTHPSISLSDDEVKAISDEVWGNLNVESSNGFEDVVRAIIAKLKGE
jgi:hypothetical protein